MTKRKTFQEGERIAFRDDPGAPWEGGTYVQASNEFPGWHRVKPAHGLGFRFVPLRRLRSDVSP